MRNKLPTAEETLLKNARRRYAGDVVYTHGDSQVVIIGDVLAAIESHTAAHTAALRERVKELEDRLSEERFHTLGFSDALGGANFRLDAMKAENTRYREALEKIATITVDNIAFKIAKEALKNNE